MMVSCVLLLLLTKIFIINNNNIVSGENSNLFQLNVIHINDFHARFDETNLKSGVCKTTNKEECIGGLARVTTVIKQLKKKPNSILLNAGDNYQGTLWYSLFKWNVTQYFMNMLPFDAYTLGNHEFDDKIHGIVDFLKSVKGPVVVSNIDDSLEPTMQGLYKKSVVIEVDGRKIGIIGVIISTTYELSSTEKLKFYDEIESINKEAKRLVEEEDVFTNIVLSHCGYVRELEIAAKVGPKVSLIVGGHSHSLLYNGTAPNNETVVGPYPTVVGGENDQMVLVVQASSYTKYLGNLTIYYDESGKIVAYDGVPVYLGTDIPKDAEMEQLLTPWREEIEHYANIDLGYTNVLLDNSNCYYAECNIGDFFVDAMIDYYQDQAEEGHWAYAGIALTNAGSIRAPIEPGNITYNDLITTYPFENTIDSGEIKGKYIKEALEWGCHHFLKRGNFNLNTALLQISGIRMVADFSRKEGDRIVSMKLRCNECLEPIYEDYDPEKTYRILLGSFLVGGGDGFTMLSKNLQNHQIGVSEQDAYKKYIGKMSPIDQGVDGRIKLINVPHDKMKAMRKSAADYNTC